MPNVYDTILGKLRNLKTYLYDSIGSESVDANTRELKEGTVGARILDWAGVEDILAILSFTYDGAGNHHIHGAANSVAHFHTVQLSSHLSVPSPQEGMIAWNFTEHALAIYTDVGWQWVYGILP